MALCAGCDPNVTGSVNRLYMGYLHVFVSVIVYALFETGIYVCVCVLVRLQSFCFFLLVVLWSCCLKMKFMLLELEGMNWVFV